MHSEHSSVSTLQAMTGRLVAERGLYAWEDDSRQRCLDLARAFQEKMIDPEALRAALASERIAPMPTTVPNAKQVALIELSGVLTPTESIFSLLGWGTSVRTFMQQLTAASVNPGVRAIVIAVDSPGGSIAMIPEASALVRQVRARKPIIAAGLGLNASAAFWITSGATAITSTQSGRIGSVGVCCERLSIAKMLEQQGVAIDVITSAPYKREGHVALPMSAAERQHLQHEIDLAHREFVGAVAVGRQTTPATVDRDYGGGRVVRADEAMRRGMIDLVESSESTLSRVMASPTALTAIHAQRGEQARTSSERARLDQARAEIASHRARIRAAVSR